jgi:anti-sigma28 factor (negative regulator of flagellin synthesis)
MAPDAFGNGIGPVEPKKIGRIEPQTEAVTRPGLQQPKPPVRRENEGDTTDRLEISEEAKQVMANNTTAPAVRPEMVDRARQMIQNGSYNNVESLGQTANKLSKVIWAEA